MKTRDIKTKKEELFDFFVKSKNPEMNPDDFFPFCKPINFSKDEFLKLLNLLEVNNSQITYLGFERKLTELIKSLLFSDLRNFAKSQKREIEKQALKQDRELLRGLAANLNQISYNLNVLRITKNQNSINFDIAELSKVVKSIQEELKR